MSDNVESTETVQELEQEVIEQLPAKPKRVISEEGKRAAAQKRAQTKEKADNLKPTVYVQYQDSEANVETILEMVKTEFRKEKKRTLITDFKLYIKPEEHTAYYVINEKFTGKLVY